MSLYLFKPNLKTQKSLLSINFRFRFLVIYLLEYVVYLHINIYQFIFYCNMNYYFKPSQGLNSSNTIPLFKFICNKIIANYKICNGIQTSSIYFGRSLWYESHFFTCSYLYLSFIYANLKLFTGIKIFSFKYTMK